MPRIIERSEWGAAPPRGGFSPVTWAPGGALVVHHTEGAEPPPTASQAAEAQVMRDIQSFHQNGRGWTDIGYHVIIFPSGRPYRGRPPEVMGAHSPGANDRPGVSFAGSYVTHAPTDAALATLAWLKAELDAGYLRGHRDYYSTSCPGDALYRRIHQPLPEPPGEPGTPPQRPHGNTLRLVVENRHWSGWEQSAGALRWIAVNGLKPGTRAALAWRGSIWRGPKDVTNVAKSLVRDYLGV